MVRRTRLLLVVAALLATADVPRPIFAAAQEDAGGPQGQARRAESSQAARANNIYLVQMAEAPVISYPGGAAGLAPTKKKRGEKIDPESADVVAYAGYLTSRHDQALGRAGGRKVYDYRYTFNGFAAAMTEAQADALRGTVGVVTVTKDTLRTADTSSTPTFLGLDAVGGLWSQLGGVDSAGEDIVIGIVDSGVWPENPSFSDRTAMDRRAAS
jgi:hypothetical protein